MVIESEVVISGIGGSFPKASNIEEFKERLLNHYNPLGSRWRKDLFDIPNAIAPIPTQEFDPTCFALYPEHCYMMDPQYRITYERAYEAILDAGVNPIEIKGQNVAVYSGIGVSDNDKACLDIAEKTSIMGITATMLSNRVSYVFNLKGTSVTYHNDWMGGVQVLEVACNQVRTNRCKAAIVITTNLVLNAETSWLYNDLNLLSPDGITRSFSENANGFGRCDGVIAFYIQRACDAKRSYATLLGARCMYNGLNDAGVRDISSENMTEFIESFYEECQVDPADVEFVECYGCGIKDYDKTELEAINNVYCKNRKEPLLIGSVKSNVGHAESASVFMSIAKVLIAMESGVIPATLHYDSPNLSCKPLTEGKLVVVDQNRKCDLKLVAVNAIGLSSSYGHVLLKANPKTRVTPADNIPRLINISTRTEEGIQEILDLLKTQKEFDHDYISLIHETYKASIPMLINRGYFLKGDAKEICAQTKSFTGVKPPLWFIYTGMGSQWIKMGADLMELPIFAKTIYKCHKVLQPKGVDLLSILTGADKNLFTNILNCFVGIAAIQIALTDILKALDIVPDGMIGHSVGELGCAYADKCLTAEEMILCAYYRGKASMEADLPPGIMAAVGMGYQNLKARCPSNIDIACHNSSESCTISGPTKDVENFVELLMDEKVFCKLVNVANIAYHSRYIKSVAPILLKYLKEVIPDSRRRSAKWISSSIPEEKWQTDLAKTSSAEYHTNNLLSAVLFEESVKHIPEGAIVVEIAPHGLLQPILKRSLIKCTHIPLTSRHSKNGLRFLLEALGKLYISGIDMNLSRIYPKVDYPTRRGTKSLTPLIKWDHSQDWSSYLDKRISARMQTNIRDFDIGINDFEIKDLTGHVIHDSIVIPTSFYLETLYSILCSLLQENRNIDVVIEDISFQDILLVPKAGKINLYVVIRKGSGNFEIMSNTKLVGTGRIGMLRKDTQTNVPLTMLDQINNSKFTLKDTDVYNEFKHRKHNYTGCYRLIKNLKLLEEGSFSTVSYNNHWPNLLESMLQQMLFHKGERLQNSLTVTGIQKIVLKVSLLPTKADDVEVVYSSSTGVISTAGITISGVKTQSLKNYEITKLQNETSFVSMVKLEDTQRKTIANVIDSSLKYCIESHKNIGNYNAKITEIPTENPLLEKVIERVLNKNSKLNTIYSIEEDIKSMIILPGQPLLVIFNDNLNQDCIDFVIFSNAFLLARTNLTSLNNRGITEITRFQVGDILYSLIRKISESIARIVPIDTNSETSLGVSLLNKISSDLLLNHENRVYLIFRRIPLQGIINQVNEIRSLPNTLHLRFVYLLDKNAPEFSVKNAFYTKIFESDLILSIVIAGSIHTYMSSTKDLEEVDAQIFKLSRNLVSNTNIKFVGVNASDAARKHSEGLMLEYLDYSSVTNSGRRKMGLGKIDSEWRKFVPDPVLTWDVPERWSLENATTVPWSYVFAYYALVINGNIDPRKTVLIQDACTPFGIAAVRVAYKFVSSIFVTVRAETQKVQLKKMFQFLTDHNIFLANVSFEEKLLEATGGNGIDIILNSFNGQMFDATMRCIADNGRFIHMREAKVTDYKTMGMWAFKANVKLNVVSIEDISDLHPDVKHKLHGLIADGIVNYTVLPLPHEVIEYSNVKTALRKENHKHSTNKILIKLLENVNTDNWNETNDDKYFLDSENSFLIYGGSPEMWLDLLEWLIFRGAKVVAIASEKVNDSYINHRINLYETYYNAKIKFVPSENDSENASLITNVNQMAPMKAVFILPESKAEEVLRINNILKSIPSNVLLVNFVANLAGICEMRNYADSVGYNVHWDASKDTFVSVLEELDGMLNRDKREMVICTKDADTEYSESTQALYMRQSSLLPSSVSKLKEEIEETTKEPDFVQLPSLTTHTKEVPPTFIIPAMFKKSVVQSLADNLLSVCYCALYPTVPMPLKDLAAAFAKRIRQIRSKGPYNIVGISYGGVLALEITRILEVDTSKTILYLLDGAPDTIQGVLRLFGNGTNSEIAFLYHTLRITNNEVLKEMSNTSGWNQRLNLALTYCGCSKHDREALTNVLTTLKKHLDEILDYQNSETPISADLCLFRPKDADQNNVCGLLKYCSQEAQVYLIHGDHNTIPNEKETANIINKYMLCW